jgi:energy-coupling factor transport system permease protein
MKSNARAWVIWIGAVAVATMLARNPLYSLVILSVGLLMMAVFGRRDEENGLPLRRLAVIILVISAVYNALFVHAGESVLFVLPDWPLIGGPVTLEAVAEGLANGLVLLTLLAIFAALGDIVPMSELTRLMPAAFRDLGLVLLIAVNYVPETRRHLRRIQDAQAIRGHELRGLRDWRPLVVPLLVGGLERAMRLSESMVARGFGSTGDEASRPVEQLALIGGLLAAVAGWFVVVWRGGAGWLLLLTGVAAMAAVVLARGRRARRTHYRQEPWRAVDVLLAGTALVTLAVVALPWSFVDRGTLAWTPYPRLALPPLDWLVMLALAGLALPALWAGFSGSEEAPGD